VIVDHLLPTPRKLKVEIDRFPILTYLNTITVIDLSDRSFAAESLNLVTSPKLTQ
jgi:hypothetical protein